MACKKVRFKNELDAKIALADIARKDKPGHEGHNRAYPCHLCRGWHTTSKEYRDPHSRD